MEPATSTAPAAPRNPLTIDHTILAPNSLVLVTGANGLIASHIIAQLLAAGFRVRGTVRSLEKSAWLLPLFNGPSFSPSSSSSPSPSSPSGSTSPSPSPSSTSTPPRFELVAVPDMAAPGAFDDAVRGGVAAVAHVASIIWNDGAASADAVIGPVVAGAVGVLESAAKEPSGSVKRVVYTSSSLAAYTPAVRGDDVDDGGVGGAAVGEGGVGRGREVSAATWNEETVRAAYAELGPGAGMEAVTRRALDIYGASKAEAERAVWRWVEEHEGKVGFEVNSVLPNVNFGRSVDPDHQGYPSTIGWPVMLATGTMPEMLWDAIRPQYWVDVEDTALLHVAALTRPDIKNRRIFAFAGRYNWNTLLAALRKMYPEKELYPDRDGLGHDLTRIIDAPWAEQILKDMGRPGWKSLEQSLRENLEAVQV
ncbi:Sugar transporter [Lasiodiplodia theobromae]|uniref:Sugar transporter n=1 Tax=Lasiodiplodia theobromae TaxID=45133 RepID=UPI0015C2C9C0|nr:Sugar transporter [Lasiodiplodia theobromae]KAF4541449.1 Sugar transporter [Lasiodiplodia theobromae]